MSTARANKNHTIFLQKLAEIGQATVAERLHTDESTISRLKEKSQMFTQVLAEIGLKIVPEGLKCYRESYVQSLEEIVREHVNGETKPPLEWD